MIEFNLAETAKFLISGEEICYIRQFCIFLNKEVDQSRVLPEFNFTSIFIIWYTMLGDL